MFYLPYPSYRCHELPSCAFSPFPVPQGIGRRARGSTNDPQGLPPNNVFFIVFSYCVQRGRKDAEGVGAAPGAAETTQRDCQQQSFFCLPDGGKFLWRDQCIMFPNTARGGGLGWSRCLDRRAARRRAHCPPKKSRVHFLRRRCRREEECMDNMFVRVVRRPHQLTTSSRMRRVCVPACCAEMGRGDRTLVLLPLARCVRQARRTPAASQHIVVLARGLNWVLSDGTK